MIYDHQNDSIIICAHVIIYLFIDSLAHEDCLFVMVHIQLSQTPDEKNKF